MSWGRTITSGERAYPKDRWERPHKWGGNYESRLRHSLERRKPHSGTQGAIFTTASDVEFTLGIGASIYKRIADNFDLEWVSDRIAKSLISEQSIDI